MKYFLTITLGLGALSMSAQLDWSGMTVIPESIAHQISQDGLIVAGETTDGSYFTHNTATGEEKYYLECSGGMGNCIASNGWMVGSNKNSSKGVILVDGNIVAIPSLEPYPESYLQGITWDGSRIVGIISNPEITGGDVTDPDFSYQMYVPVYMDVDSEGNVGEPRILPHPELDWFKAVPQYCTAVWISNDGKTIAGQVIDNTGWYMYPIIYTCNDEGEWECSYPSESLFNMKKEEVPTYPKFEMEQLQATDFMTPEEKEEFEAALNDPNFEGDPYDLLHLFMTPEEYKAFEAYLTELEAYIIQYNQDLNNYYAAIVPIIQNSVFFEQNSMALSADGSILASPQWASYMLENQMMPVNFYIPFVFDLKEGTYRQVGDKYSMWNTNQVLPDGTVVLSTPNVTGYSYDETPVHSGVILPGADEVTLIEDWIATFNPSYAEWMHEYLYHEVGYTTDSNGVVVSKGMTVTGLVAVSNDCSVIAGGVDGWTWDPENGMYFTYILNGETGVESIESDGLNAKDGVYRVYNLQGVNVMNTTDAASLKNLPKGLYIVNGKKIMR